MDRRGGTRLSGGGATRWNRRTGPPCDGSPGGARSSCPSKGHPSRIHAQLGEYHRERERRRRTERRAAPRTPVAPEPMVRFAAARATGPPRRCPCRRGCTCPRCARILHRPPTRRRSREKALCGLPEDARRVLLDAQLVQPPRHGLLLALQHHSAIIKEGAPRVAAPAAPAARRSSRRAGTGHPWARPQVLQYNSPSSEI